MTKHKVLILGAGFGGLELTSLLSETPGENFEITLIDKSDSFAFGFSKLDVMFGRKESEAVRVYYHNIKKPGVTFKQETIVAINPEKREVKTEKGTYRADTLVIALGADYDPSATPGLEHGGNEFYSFEGAKKLREVLPNFNKGHAIVGVTSTPFKCPPAPSEAALLLHDYLKKRGVREECKISVVIPFGVPIPPSPATSKALIQAFAERDIQFIPDRLVRALDSDRKIAILDDKTEISCDLLLAIPKHRVPDVVAQSGMTEDGWIPVDRKNLKTKFANVYAIGDVNSVGTPKAGVFAEGAAKVVAECILADIQGANAPAPYDGAGACYIEFGNERVARVDVNFLSGPKPTGSFTEPSIELIKDKRDFGAIRTKRWFGLG